MRYSISILWDNEAAVWIATSKDIKGLVLESGSLDALIEKVKNAIPELIELNGLPKGTSIPISFHSEREDIVMVG